MEQAATEVVEDDGSSGDARRERPRRWRLWEEAPPVVESGRAERESGKGGELPNWEGLNLNQKLQEILNF